jgi:hypothetical protein
MSEDQYVLVLIFHHISVDRGSTESFLKQLTSLYDRIRSSGNITEVEKPAVSYADFAAWHNSRLESEELAPDVEFWKKKYSNMESGPSKLLPFAKAERPPQNDYQRAIARGNITKSAHNRMKRVAARLGASPFQFLLAAFRSYLYRWTGDEDLTVNTHCFTPPSTLLISSCCSS